MPEWHAWLVFAIYMLLLFFFLVVSICINTACLICKLNRSNSNRSRFERQFVEETIANEYSIQFPSSSFESSVINSLPTFQFKRDEGKEQMPVNAECAICLGEFEEGEWLKLLPSCTHGFHVSCIDTWFQSHSNCPLCRSCVSHDLVADTEYSVSLYRLLEVETLSREEYSAERAVYLQSIRSEIPHEFCPH